MEAILDAKKAGDEAFKEQNYSEAISKWSDALEKMKGASTGDIKDTKRVLYSNRSSAFMHTNNLSAALLDADKCIATDTSWFKGYLRRAEVPILTLTFLPIPRYIHLTLTP